MNKPPSKRISSFQSDNIFLSQMATLREIVNLYREFSIKHWEACTDKVEGCENKALGKFTSQIKKNDPHAN